MDCLRCIFAVIPILSVISCSVKTDRSDCPCRLQMHFDPGLSGTVNLCGWSGKDCVFRVDDVLPALSPEGVLTMEVPRKDYVLTVWTGDTALEGSCIMTDPGSQSDSLYACRLETSMTTASEKIDASVRMRKQFSTVYVRVEDADTSANYSVVLKGTASGLDLLDMEPVPGRFACRVYASDRWYCMVRVPRQQRGGLELELLEDDTVVMSLDVCDHMEEKDFDWEADELEDIYVELDAVSLDVRVGVGGWRESKEQELVI